MEITINKGRDYYLSEIRRALGLMVVELTSENKDGGSGRNRTNEMIICGLLNRMYHYNLVNANTPENPNFPGVDLVDWERRVGVQVTVSSTPQKIDDTMKKVLNNRECDNVSHLIIMMITFTNPTSSMKKRKADRWFDGEKDIWTLNKIMADLRKPQYSTDTLREIDAYLKAELGLVDLFKEREQEREATVKAVAAEADPERKEKKPPASGKYGVKSGLWLAGALVLLLAIACIWGLSRGPRETEAPALETEDLLMWAPVAEKLRGADLSKTAVPLSIYEPGLNAGGNLGSMKRRSVAYPFAVYCTNAAVNPISAFNKTRDEWFVPRKEYAEWFILPLESYEMDWREPDTWQDYLYELYEMPEAEWEWSRTGTEAFLAEVLAVAGKCGDGFDLDERFLSEIHRSEEPVIHYSSDGECYYTYFIYYGDYYSYIVSIYFREDPEKLSQISDVQFQILHMRYADGAGGGAAYSQMLEDDNCQRQVAALIMSIEHLLTGTSVFDEEIDRMSGSTGELYIPVDYSIGDYGVTITQNSYSSIAVLGTGEEEHSVEDCELLTYWIKK